MSGYLNHVSESELRAIISSAVIDQERLYWKAVAELAWQSRATAFRRMGNPEGRCKVTDRVVYADQTGAYSSGYVCYKGNHGVCPHDVEWFRSEKRERLLGVVDELKRIEEHAKAKIA